MTTKLVSHSLLIILVVAGVMLGLSSSAEPVDVPEHVATQTQPPSSTTTTPAPAKIKTTEFMGYAAKTKETEGVLHLGLEHAFDGTITWYPLTASTTLSIYERAMDASYAITPDHRPHYDEAMTLQKFSDLVYRSSSPYTLEVILTVDNAGNVLAVSQVQTQQ